MKITIESTSKIVHVNGTPCRIWEGTTEHGVAVHALIARVGCKLDADTTEFERDLVETRAPSAEVAAYPPRLIL